MREEQDIDLVGRMINAISTVSDNILEPRITSEHRITPERVVFASTPSSNDSKFSKYFKQRIIEGSIGIPRFKEQHLNYWNRESMNDNSIVSFDTSLNSELEKYIYEEKHKKEILKERIEKLKLQDNIKINRNENNTIAYKYNKNSYNNYLEETVRIYDKIDKYEDLQNLNKIVSEETIKTISKIYKTFLEKNFKFKYDKHIHINITNFDFKKDSERLFEVKILNTYATISIYFDTNNRSISLRNDSISNSSKRLKTYNVNFETEIGIKPIVDVMQYNNRPVEMNRQQNPEISLNRTIQFSEPEVIGELVGYREEIGNIEKLLSIAKFNISFLEDLVRMYLNKNEVINFLHMSKIKLELMSGYGIDISEEISTTSRSIHNLRNLIKQNKLDF